MQDGGISIVKIILVDNGSLEPPAILATRTLAEKLSVRIKQHVHPVSLLHSDNIPADKLNGVVAETIETFLRREARQGEMDFKVLPLFFGPSRALTEYLPELVEKLRRDFASLRLSVAPALYQARDDRLAQMLTDRVRETKQVLGLSPTEPVRVALVDHGSPVAAVTAVRDALAVKLAGTLGASASAVAPCSMERRPGPAYALNEPLLADLLARDRWNAGSVIVAQLFLNPGRHAGPGGDIEQICRQAEANAPALRTIRTEVLGSHPMLTDILVDRCHGLAASTPQPHR